MSLLSACSSTPATTSATTSPNLTPAPSQVAAGYRVLITSNSANGSEISLYDSASNAPQSLVTLTSGPPHDAGFISSEKIAYNDTTSGPSGMVFSFDLSTHASNREVVAPGLVPAFAFSHDGSIFAYLDHDTSGAASLHIRRNGQEHTLVLNAIPGRGTDRNDEVRLQFSPDDKYLLMVDTYVGNQAQAPQTGQFLVLNTADDSVVFYPQASVSSNATMATWANHSDRLYFRDQIGVRTWDAQSSSAGQLGTLVAGLRWYDPAVSADDRDIAYTAIDSGSVPHVMLLDLQNKQSTLLSSAPRSHPIFITNALLWYLEEQPCQSECLGGPSQPSGKVFAYSLASKAESGMPFTDVQTLSQESVAGR